MTQFTIERANQFIKANKHLVNPQYRPQVHFTAPIGWINDPNGFIFYQGEYHLFYQHYPYDAIWGPMHWGHAKSRDLIHWEHLPVALAPDKDYDLGGCFSGSAIEKDGKLWLMYTGNIQNEQGEPRQIQNIAVSEDGVHFEKIAQNPVLTEADLPEGIVPADFRDPKVFEKDGKYYAVIVARHVDGVGCVLLYSSDDLIEWQYESIFLKGTKEQGEMWECPDYFNLDGVDTLMMSPMRFGREDLSHHNLNTTVVVKGKVAWDKKEFIPEQWEELDHGHDFYAPQTLEDDQGRRIMIAWMNTWGRHNVTKELGHQWAFGMTMPRVLNWRDNQFTQTPVLTEAHLTAETTDDLSMNQAKLLVLRPREQADFELRVGSANDYISIRYEKDGNAVYLDRENLRIDLLGEEKEPVTKRGFRVTEDQLTRLEIILDTNSIELIANDGTATLSSNIYLEEGIEPAVTLCNGEVEISSYVIQ
ncbi:glycoside hydrolase family 32 protein [Globicatella sanguinis]